MIGILSPLQPNPPGSEDGKEVVERGHIGEREREDKTKELSRDRNLSFSIPPSLFVPTASTSHTTQGYNNNCLVKVVEETSASGITLTHILRYIIIQCNNRHHQHPWYTDSTRRDDQLHTLMYLLCNWDGRTQHAGVLPNAYNNIHVGMLWVRIDTPGCYILVLYTFEWYSTTQPTGRL